MALRAHLCRIEAGAVVAHTDQDLFARGGERHRDALRAGVAAGVVDRLLGDAVERQRHRLRKRRQRLGSVEHDLRALEVLHLGDQRTQGFGEPEVGEQRRLEAGDDAALARHHPAEGVEQVVEAAAHRLQGLGGQLAGDPHRIHAHRRQQRAELVVQLGREAGVLRLAGFAQVAGEAGQLGGAGVDLGLQAGVFRTQQGGDAAAQLLLAPGEPADHQQQGDDRDAEHRIDPARLARALEGRARDALHARAQRRAQRLDACADVGGDRGAGDQGRGLDAAAAAPGDELVEREPAPLHRFGERIHRGERAGVGGEAGAQRRERVAGLGATVDVGAQVVLVPAQYIGACARLRLQHLQQQGVEAGELGGVGLELFERGVRGLGLALSMEDPAHPEHEHERQHRQQHGRGRSARCGGGRGRHGSTGRR